MSDSLRDQLLQAGFKKPAKEPAKKKPNHRQAKPRQSQHGQSSRQQTNKPTAQEPQKSPKAIADTAAAERKAIKDKIKTLIEEVQVKEFAGEVVYRFILQNRIRELHVAEAIRTQLVEGSLTITRLNGTTRLVPSAVVIEIQALNPNWAIVSSTSVTSDTEDGYDDFPVPDDIIW
ncbi:MAG: hypothetical protein ACI8VW_004066 [bacterium]|jgi:uncharacterized protein YaiL (DUF2058 family)